MLRAVRQHEQKLATFQSGRLLVVRNKGKGERREAGQFGGNICIRLFLAALGSTLAFKHALAEVG